MASFAEKQQLTQPRTIDELSTRQSPQMSHLRSALVEATASVVGSFACVYTGQPLDTVKVRLQSRPHAYSSALQCLTKTLKQESVASLWKGSTPALAGAVTENALAFVLNAYLKKAWPPTQDYPYLQPIAYGGVTGAVAALALCPFDVVKCKVQVTRSGPSGRALNAREMAVHVAKTQGLPGLYRGLGIQIVSMFIIMCSQCTIYYFTFITLYLITPGDANSSSCHMSCATDTRFSVLLDVLWSLRDSTAAQRALRVHTKRRLRSMCRYWNMTLLLLTLCYVTLYFD
jgi:Mitochondrial carrier protein